MAKYSSTAKARGPSRLLAFKLGGTAALPIGAETPVSQPPRPRQPTDLARRGAVLFEQSYCADCHGSHAEGAGGSVPDLRNCAAVTHDRFEAIVMGGLFREEGMPAFPDLPLADTQAIHAYLINQAWEDYEAQEARKIPH
jgi:quinohemoprotein ethanol dehydrogenase